MSLENEDVAMTETAKKTAKRKEFELDHLLHPAGAFASPADVVDDPDMTVQEKRAILAAWASDACAVEAAPELRNPQTAGLVRFDDIVKALNKLDSATADRPDYGRFINRARRWKELYRNDRGGRSLFG
jgi:hypothetical protein